MPQQNYLDELTPAFTPLLAIKEASRCLLCHDAPCSQACPAQTDPGKFIRSIYFRNFKGAAETIRENNALGAVCARVCPTEKLCQSGCTRAGVDAPIDIGRLQRFVTDFEQQTGMEIYQPGTKTLGKVAIIGAGPAGLQASVTLTNQGYDVTIYEKEAQPGGWLRNGIPQFRLPQSVLDAEIARIEKMGVTIKCNNEIGKTLTLEQLKAENRAVLVTVGLSSGSGLSLFEHSDVEIAVDFLHKYILGGQDIHAGLIGVIDDIPELLNESVRVGQIYRVQGFIRPFFHAQQDNAAVGIGEGRVGFPNAFGQTAKGFLRLNAVVLPIFFKITEVDHTAPS